MRFFLGLVCGVLLTIAVAYLIDASSPPSTDTTAQVDHRPMVNWDVVDRDWRNFTSGVRNAWHKLARN